MKRCVLWLHPVIPAARNEDKIVHRVVLGMHDARGRICGLVTCLCVFFLPREKGSKVHGMCSSKHILWRTLHVQQDVFRLVLFRY